VVLGTYHVDTFSRHLTIGWSIGRNLRREYIKKGEHAARQK
jgi:hypothetical protein